MMKCFDMMKVYQSKYKYAFPKDLTDEKLKEISLAALENGLSGSDLRTCI